MKDKEMKGQYDALIEQMTKELASGSPLTGRGGILTPLIKQMVEGCLEGEMAAHLDGERGRSAGNRRNGRKAKSLAGPFEGALQVLAPRDRDGSFEPQIVKKRERRLCDGLDGQILSLFRHGMSYGDIQDHLEEIYGARVSKGTLSSITDRILPEILEWRQRPLETLYPVVWLDAAHFKVRQDGQVVKKAVYSVLGVDASGRKDVLGIYFGDTESAGFWRSVLYDLRERGVKDILVACMDNLTGFADAMEESYVDADVQLCLVHQMRNSAKYASSKDLKPLMRDLKRIYNAGNESMALLELEAAREAWGKKYPTVFKSWDANWDRLMNFYRYPTHLRRIIYTTNPIESFHRMLRKSTKTKGAFTSEKAILKVIYLAVDNAETKWQGQMYRWPSVRNDLAEMFGKRFTNPDTLK
jgi:transposase-like protein